MDTDRVIDASCWKDKVRNYHNCDNNRWKYDVPRYNYTDSHYYYVDPNLSYDYTLKVT